MSEITALTTAPGGLELTLQQVADFYGQGYRNFAGRRITGEIQDVDFSGANFRGANFRGAQMRRCNFTGSDMFNVDLRQASLHDANLTKVGAQGAKMWRAMLTGAEVASANFSGAEAPDANFGNLTVAGVPLTQAIVDNPDSVPDLSVVLLDPRTIVNSNWYANGVVLDMLLNGNGPYFGRARFEVAGGYPAAVKAALKKMIDGET